MTLRTPSTPPASVYGPRATTGPRASSQRPRRSRRRRPRGWRRRPQPCRPPGRSAAAGWTTLGASRRTRGAPRPPWSPPPFSSRGSLSSPWRSSSSSGAPPSSGSAPGCSCCRVRLQLKGEKGVHRFVRFLLGRFQCKSKRPVYETLFINGDLNARIDLLDISVLVLKHLLTCGDFDARERPFNILTIGDKHPLTSGDFDA